MADQANVPEWFYRSISTGLAALVVLHLPGAPSHEVISYTEDVWVRALWSANVAWQEDLDAPRLAEAFLRLTRQVDRWPAPRALLELLPARPEPIKLAAPQVSRAEREQNSRRLRELIERLASKKAVRHG